MDTDTEQREQDLATRFTADAQALSTEFGWTAKQLADQIAPKEVVTDG